MTGSDRCLTTRDVAELLNGTATYRDSEVRLRHASDCRRCADMLEHFEAEGCGEFEKLASSWNAPRDTVLDEQECNSALAGARDCLLRSSGLAEPVQAFTSPAVNCLPVRQLGSYRLIRPVGMGGMGAVYEAVHEGLSKTVAVKLLAPHRLNSESAVRRFQHEGKALGGLSHPNIVSATDAGVESGIPFLAMELVVGVDLQRLVKKAGVLSIADACEIARQVAFGLAHAHEHQVIHRDIKPGNVMLTSAGGVKVLDLGLAVFLKSLGSSPDATLTATGETLGTIEFMAPEQWNAPASVGVPTDVYALGATLFFLLTGTPPLPRSEFQSLSDRWAAVTSVVPSVRVRREEVSTDLDALLCRLLQPAVSERPQSMLEVVELLTPHATGHELQVVADAAMTHSANGSFQGGWLRSEIASAAPPAGACSKNGTRTVRRSRIAAAITGATLTLATVTVAAVAVVVSALLLWKSSSATGIPQAEPSTVAAATVGLGAPLASDAADSTTDHRSSATWQRGPVRPRFDGLIPEPSTFGEFRRWELETRLPHSEMLAFQWAPDRQKFAVGTTSGRIRVYRLVDGQPELQQVFCESFPAGALQLMWSPDSRWIATAGWDQPIRLWDTQRYAVGAICGRVLSEERVLVTAIAWHRDASRFAAGDSTGCIRIWDTEGRVVELLQQQGPSLTAIEWSHDCRFLWMADSSGQVRRWDSETRNIETIGSFNSSVTDLAANPAESSVAVCIDGETEIRLLQDIGDWQTISPASGIIRELAWSRNGTRLAAVGDAVWCRDFSDGTSLTAASEGGDVRHLHWIAGEEVIAWCGGNSELVNWNPDSGAITSIVRVAQRTLRSVSWSPDGGRLAAAGLDGQVCIWNDDGAIDRVIPSHRGHIESVSWNPRTNHVAATAGWGNGGDWTVRIWDADSGRLFRSLTGHDSGILCARWSPDGRYLATGGGDLTIRVWSLQDGRCIALLQGHTAHVQAVDWNSSGTMLASGGLDQTLRLWDVSEVIGTESRSVATVSAAGVLDVAEPVGSLHWSPENDAVAVAGTLGKTYLVDIESGQALWSAQAPFRPSQVDWSSSTNLLVAGLQGLIDPASGVCYPAINAEWAVAVSPDGLRLAATGLAHELTVYDVEDFRLAAVWTALLPGNGPPVSFSAAGQPVHPPNADEQVFVCVCEHHDGSMELIPPAEFAERVRSRK